MLKTSKPLTAVAIANAKPDPSKRIEIADVATPGLALVVHPTGVKAWVLRYRAWDKKPVRMTLGRAAGAGALSLAEAREAAGNARKVRSAGQDPVANRQADRAAEATRIKAAKIEARRKDDLVENVVERFIAKHVSQNKSATNVSAMLRQKLKPWHGRKVQSITRQDVLNLIGAIDERGHGSMANRTLANTRKFFGWCVDHGIVDTSPCVGVKAVKREVSRDRVLSDDELRILCAAVAEMKWPWRQFLWAVLLTGQRRDEVAGMEWRELEFDAASPVWILPGARTKNGREHAVPLSPAVVETLASVPKVDKSPFVYTTTGTTSVSGYSRAKAGLDKKMLEIAREQAARRGEDPAKVEIARWTLHDLRRTAASGMARLGVQLPVIEKVLNHISGSFGGIVGVYQRHTFIDEKRHALAVWADHIAGLTKPRGENQAKAVA